jgi:LacI family transcriptional regulator
VVRGVAATTTMSDVARRAGVTKQTVSNVVTGRVRVRSDTEARVRAAIEELGYTPNLVARSLVTGSTMTVGLFVPTVVGSFYAELIEEVEDVLHRHGYHLLLCTTRLDGERARRQLAGVSSRNVDALLIAGDRDLIDHLPLLADARFPVVLCAWETAAPAGYPVVTIDYAEAGRLAGRHLRELGHTRAAVLASPAHGVRVEGFRAGFEDDPGADGGAGDGKGFGEGARDGRGEDGDGGCRDGRGEEDRRRGRGANGGRGATVSVYYAAEPTPTGGFAAAQAAFAADPGVTALFATHDVLALGALEAARAAGRVVPSELSVVGHDDSPEVRQTWPALTSVAIPKREMARAAIEGLLRAIREPGAESEPEAGAEPESGSGPEVGPTRIRMLRPVLVVRGSTAAAPPPRNS